MPNSMRFSSTCTCPCGCMSPPITPNDSQGRPSFITIAGTSVWNGRFPGATWFGWPASSVNSAPRFWSAIPVSPATTPEPNAS